MSLSYGSIVKFNTLASKVVVVFGSSSLYWVTLDSTTGIILNSYWDAGLTFSSVSSGMIIDASDNIYFGISTV